MRLPAFLFVVSILLARAATAMAQPADNGDAGAPPTAAPDGGVAEPDAPLVPPPEKPPEPNETAPAKPEPAPSLALPITRGLRVNGYLLPLFVFTQRDNAVARDRVQVGILSSRVGLVVQGAPFEKWSYRIELGFDAALISNRQAAGPRVVNDVGFVDPGTGNPVIRTSSTFITNVPVEEASVSYQPIGWYTVKVGHMRMPFSVAHVATITTTMFPNRPGPTEVFMSGPDDGLLNIFEFLEGRLQARLGAFNGSSLGLQVPNTTPLGPVYSLFLDVQPLGRLPPREGGAVRGPLRIGLGMGSLYRIGTLFDETGYEATRFSDARLSAAARVTFLGVFLQGEILRRVQQDNLSLRPNVATGVYGQGSYYLPFSGVAIGPLARVGLSVQNESFAPQKTLSYEAGLAFYPNSDLLEPDALRILVQYIGERRTPSEETANGAIVHLQLKF